MPVSTEFAAASLSFRYPSIINNLLCRFLCSEIKKLGIWIQSSHVERYLPATANRDVDLNEASSTMVQVNVYIFSTNSLQQLKKFPFRNFERDFFQFDFF